MLETSQVGNGATAPADDPMRRVRDRIAAMTREQKLAQLVGLWAGVRRGDDVAPMQERLLAEGVFVDEFARDGLGQFTRHYGTTPLAVTEGVRLLAERQERLMTATAPGIPATVHEECLTGVLAWGATAYPTPLAWGAAFDPPLVREMASRIGADLRALGVHQGLAPVVDVVRDPRWGRVEECIGEDPLLVGVIGAAYVEGLESEGRVATLKHFVAYSGSHGAVNHGPISVGVRELEDVYLPPFERAIRAGARSVMNSYADVDGVPPAASADLLTGILRDRWGFAGTVVADYFAVTFLQTMHGVAETLEDAACLALEAGVDVELPTGSAYLAPLAAAVASGRIDEDLVDRALERVLRQKAELGLLGDEPLAGLDPGVDLDSAANRRVARELARRSVVLLRNDGVLPLAPERSRVAVIGPNADRFEAVFGCYSFVNHVLPRHPEVLPVIAAPTVAEALETALGSATVERSAGCEVTGDDRSGFADACAAAARAEVAVVVVGDRSGMFGRGTSGEGCDVTSLRLPGMQHEFVEAVLDTGTPVVLVLVTGRPYALGDLPERCAAIVQAFLPGQEGGTAIAEVLTGAVVPSGRLPVGVPTAEAPQPSGYRRARLGGPTGVSSADPTPAFPFGFGLSYTTFEHGPLRVRADRVATDDVIGLEVTVRNAGARAGADVLQVYAHDPVAQVARPLRELVAFHRTELAPGEEQAWLVEIPATALAYAGKAGRRIVEPGRIELVLAANAEDEGLRADVTLVGDVLAVDVIADAPTWTLITNRPGQREPLG